MPEGEKAISGVAAEARCAVLLAFRAAYPAIVKVPEFCTWEWCNGL
jgi:hypothetical protein